MARLRRLRRMRFKKPPPSPEQTIPQPQQNPQPQPSPQHRDLWAEPALIPSGCASSNDDLWAEPAIPPSDSDEDDTDVANSPRSSEDESWDKTTPSPNRWIRSPAPPHQSTKIDDQPYLTPNTNLYTTMLPDLAPPNLDIIDKWSPTILGHHHHIFANYSPSYTPNLNPTQQLSILLSPPKYILNEPPLSDQTFIHMNE